MVLRFMHFLAFCITIAFSVPDTPCTKRRAAETAYCGIFLGCFIVSCEADGSFSPTQCYGSIGTEIGIEFIYSYLLNAIVYMLLKAFAGV